MIAYLFPGQGTQKPGMLRGLGDNYQKIKQVFELASDVAGKDVADLCLNASEDELKKTENTQIAVTAMNMAYYNLLNSENIKPDIVLGHSLGQYSAFVAAGVISMEDAFRVICKRAELMAGITRQGALCTILGLSYDEVQDICNTAKKENGGIVSIALHNTEKQIVIGGDESSVAYAEELSKKKGAIRTVILRVSNAFHTDLMEGMVEEFKEFVSKIKIYPPKCKIMLNCKGTYLESEDEVISETITQCCHTVRWYDCMKELLQLDNLLMAEVGIGKTLTGMVRNINSEKKVLMLSNPKQYDQFISMAKEEFI